MAHKALGQVRHAAAGHKDGLTQCGCQGRAPPARMGVGATASLAHAVVGRGNGGQGVQTQLHVVVAPHQVVNNAHGIAACCGGKAGGQGKACLLVARAAAGGMLVAAL